MKLLLSGGGDAVSAAYVDTFFAKQIDLEKTVLYVPVASEDDPSYTECFDWFRKTYLPYGIEKFEMCTDLNTVPELERYSAIFIGGGNTFKLLKEIKDSRFDKKLKDYLRNGGIVYGSSAGSIIFGKDILPTTYEDENNVGLEDSTGLNLLKGFNICCHYGDGDEVNTNYKRNRIKKYAAQSNGTFALPENCAIFVEENIITFIHSTT